MISYERHDKKLTKHIIQIIWLAFQCTNQKTKSDAVSTIFLTELKQKHHERV